jgi:hypothetical protein
MCRRSAEDTDEDTGGGGREAGERGEGGAGGQEVCGLVSSVLKVTHSQKSSIRNLYSKYTRAMTLEILTVGTTFIRMCVCVCV